MPLRAAPRSMEYGVPPLEKGDSGPHRDFRGFLGVAHNLVSVVDRGTRPGAARPLSLR